MAVPVAWQWPSNWEILARKGLWDGGFFPAANKCGLLQNLKPHQPRHDNETLLTFALLLTAAGTGGRRAILSF